MRLLIGNTDLQARCWCCGCSECQTAFFRSRTWTGPSRSTSRWSSKSYCFHNLHQNFPSS